MRFPDLEFPDPGNVPGTQPMTMELMNKERGPQTRPCPQGVDVPFRGWTNRASQRGRDLLVSGQAGTDRLAKLLPFGLAASRGF